MTSPFEDLTPLAQEFVGLLLRFDFTSATARFDDQMKSTFSETKLQDSWQNLIKEAGTLLQMDVERTQEVENYWIVIIRCHFQRSIIDVQVVFNDQEQISGLNFIPTQMEYHPPAYVNEAAFHEMEVTIGEGLWALPGTLTLPDGPSPFPGVVLVHGSGPNDRDESIGPNKTFRDLAWGLASKGVAVLRYDKRTYTHAQQFTPEEVNNLTAKEEVLDDALLAIDLMRQRTEVDPKRVFMLGHSLGATLAPRLGQMDPELAGIIIMAGITRPLEDTILDQFTYLYHLSGEITDQQKAELADLQVKVDKVKGLESSDHISSQDLPLGISVAYWQDLREHNVVDAAKTLKMPILVLQGGRDYQVLETEDFKGWKDALKHRDNVTFQLFPELNHLFIEGEGKSTPQEYLVEGHVQEEVINTIAEWILI
jgi:dienelactone hydrolase